MTRLDTEKTQGNIALQFSPGILQKPLGDFSPRFIDIVSDTTI